MSHARDDGEGPTRQTDEFGNLLPQPSTTSMYGGPISAKGGAVSGQPTGDAEVFSTGYNGGQPQQQHRPAGGRPAAAAVAGSDDVTRRRGTTTGEYGQGVGLMDGAKEKLAGLGGFKEDPGHVTTSGEPMEAAPG